MKKNAVYLFGNTQYLFAIGNTLLQLKRFTFIDKFIIAIENIDEATKSLLQSLDDRITVIENIKDIVFQYLKKENHDANFIKRFSSTVLYRYFAVEHLRDYENIIVLDADNYYRNSFEDIIHEFNKGEISYRPSNKLSSIDKSISSDICYPSGAVIIFNKSLYYKKDIFLEEVFNYINKNINFTHIDEMAFSYAALKLNLKVNYLPIKFNSFAHYNESLDSAIVCSVSKYKFWSHPICILLYNKWHEYNSEWNKLCQEKNLSRLSLKIKSEIGITDIFNLFEKGINHDKSQFFTNIFKYLKYKLNHLSDFSFSPIKEQYWFAFYPRHTLNQIHYEFIIENGYISFNLHFETDNEEYNNNKINYIYEQLLQTSLSRKYKINKYKNNYIFGINIGLSFHNEYQYLDLYACIMEEFIKNTIEFI